jgi:hypothetical protein
MRRALPALAVVLLLAGCGYRLAAPNSALPGGLKAVSVPVFRNRTAEPAAELAFTRAMRERLERAGRLGGSDAPGRLEGTILSVSGAPYLTAPSLPRQPAFRLAASVQLQLFKDGAPLSTVTVSGSEEFVSGADVLLTEANRGAALQRLADMLMREGLERLQAP